MTTPSERVQRLREETAAVRKAAEVVGIPGHTGAGDPDATDKVMVRELTDKHVNREAR